jgi:DNA-binding PadR family transcriptional regulator
MTLARVYETLSALRDRGLIEPAEVDTTTRQTALRRSFRATASGIEAYRGWLSSSVAARVALWEP